MRERPIIYSAPMVRATLEDLKTQTRRIVQPQPPENATHAGYFNAPGKPYDGVWLWLEGDGEDDYVVDAPRFRCPYGNKPGDRLWVRETWSIYSYTAPCPGAPTGDVAVPECRADLPPPSDLDPIETSVAYRADTDGDMVCYSPIHMPRWASRITLEVTGVRVERLQDISRGDCMAEGCPFPNIAKETDPVKWFSDLWDSLNAKRAPWDSNPWVWVLEFQRIAV